MAPPQLLSDRLTAITWHCLKISLPQNKKSTQTPFSLWLPSPFSTVKTKSFSTHFFFLLYKLPAQIVLNPYILISNAILATPNSLCEIRILLGKLWTQVSSARTPVVSAPRIEGSCLARSTVARSLAAIPLWIEKKLWLSLVLQTGLNSW